MAASIPPTLRKAFLALSLAMLAVATGCEKAAQHQDDASASPWFEVATVADLTHVLATREPGATLAIIKDLGFDTVLLDIRSTPAARLKPWLDEAERQQMRQVVWVASPAYLPPAKTGNTAAPPSSVLHADAVIITVEHTADLDYARSLRAALDTAGSGAALIARPAAGKADKSVANDLSPPAGPFAAILSETGSLDSNSLTDWTADESPMRPSGGAQSNDQGQAATSGLATWQRLSVCNRARNPECSEDIRRLTTGLMQPPVPVIEVLDGPYWHAAYRSLIQIRRDYPFLRSGTLEWYATDPDAGALAYRITNEERQHILVAINVSDQHLELPLPFGFMAVSKIKLWASYDPTVRELVTSKPVALPARSAVVVIRD
jgi:hypothetical protein